MNTKEKIEVMQALSVDGRTIQAKFRTGQTWDDIVNRNWGLFNFAEYEYRIKPELVKPPLGPIPLFIRIEKTYEDKQVVMLEWNLNYLIMKGKGHGHTSAQSMKDFNGYVYEVPDVDNKFYIDFSPLRSRHCKEGIHAMYPVAVLFDK